MGPAKEPHKSLRDVSISCYGRQSFTVSRAQCLVAATDESDLTKKASQAESPQFTAPHIHRFCIIGTTAGHFGDAAAGLVALRLVWREWVVGKEVIVERILMFVPEPFGFFLLPLFKPSCHQILEVWQGTDFSLRNTS